MDINKIAVIGAGTMGHSIALSFALNDYEVIIVDKEQQILDKAKEKIDEEISLMEDVGYIEENERGLIINKIKFSNNMKVSLKDRDYVIEAVSERLELKQKVFKEMDYYSPEHAILATNTSSLKLMDIIGSLSKERQEKCLISHWFNPAYIMPIIELSYFGNTNEDIYKSVEELYSSMNKNIIKVYKDIPGLVATRLQQSLAREVYHLLEEGVVSEEDVDKAVKYGPSFRHTASGLLEVCDMGGIDIWSAVADNLFPELSNTTESSNLLKSKLEQGYLGIKTGKGFYNYKDRVRIKDDFNRKLLLQLQLIEKF